MKKKSIFKQLIVPMITIVVALSVVLVLAIVITVSKSFENEILNRNLDKSKLMSGEISAFMDGAFRLTEDISQIPEILTMNTELQTPILENCVKNNPYLELLYIQGTDGMQTARSSGTLADRSTRWWFKQTMQDKKSFVSKSYYSVNTGMPCASIFFPMYNKDELLGVFAVDIKLDHLQGIIDEISDEDAGEYSFVIDGEGVVVAHPDSSQIEELYNYVNLTKTVSSKDAKGNVLKDENGNILTEEQPIEISEDYQEAIADVMAGNSKSVKIRSEGVSYYISYSSIPLLGASDSWSVITVQKVSSAMKMVYFIIIISIIATVVAIILAIGIITKLAQKLTAPILSLTDLVTAAADGDFSKKADEDNENEIGTLAAGFNKMSNQISATLKDLNLLGIEVVHSSDKLSELESTSQSINNSVKAIKEGTQEQTIEVNEVVEKSSELGKRFEELKNHSKELLKTVEDTVKSERVGVENIKELEKQNENTTKMINESKEKIVVLEEQSKEIFSIVETIGEISSETSLLALNASIEAARAGEQGKGFAVVAESIGKLANDSNTATSSIGEIIEKLCGDIESTVKNIETVNEVVIGQSEMVNKVEATFENFKEFAEKTDDIVKSFETLVNQMSDIGSQIVKSVENIRTISKNTEGITEEVSVKLEEQLVAISLVAQKVNDLSKATGK